MPGGGSRRREPAKPGDRRAASRRCSHGRSCCGRCRCRWRRGSGRWRLRRACRSPMCAPVRPATPPPAGSVNSQPRSWRAACGARLFRPGHSAAVPALAAEGCECVVPKARAAAARWRCISVPRGRSAAAGRGEGRDVRRLRARGGHRRGLRLAMKGYGELVGTAEARRFSEGVCET